ncbi:conserved hypothetical protein [Pseudomonas sp. 8Z]|uniref:hypothetical protein n=1 Tax=Pseudomonas sp. 8Z TaxID=2653166 RepID=UPI0012F00EEB|nr:hypothetical protein [Pseudomonas sp. 8Z]VXC66057.1 conserved hypothetical protein [Pseudomonas sp. 8Z]
MMSRRNSLLPLIAMALLTTALGLLGIGKGSAGVMARHLECSQQLQQRTDLARQHERGSLGPPPHGP